ncbi:MAG: AI-2E family transporter [Pseudomonadota bacterium]
MRVTEAQRTRTGTQIAVLVFCALGSFSIVVTGLILGKSFFIPLAIALLLFVLLTAIIEYVKARKWFGVACPGWLAAVLGISSVLLGLFVVVMILGRQATQVTAAVPTYQKSFATIFSRVVSFVGEDNAKMVETKLNGLDLSGFAVDAVGQAGSVLGGLVLVLLYIAFMMAEKGPMSRKLPLAIGDQERFRNFMRIVDEVVEAQQRYVGVKTFCSALMGISCYTVLRIVGLDFAETWGLLAFALNFIPTIGAILGVLLPSLVALVQFEAIGPLAAVFFGCGIAQFIIGAIVEPALMGRRLNLAPFMVILALVVWGTLWGISGAFLSVPITVCLLIVFGHIPATRPVAILMSGDGLVPPLEPASAPAEDEESEAR